MTAIARTIRLLRSEGYIAQSVERYNYHAKRRVDLFSVIDVIAVHPGKQGVLGVQVTTASNLSSRVKKAIQTPELKTWLLAGNRFEVHAWRKTPIKPKSKKMVWVVNRREVTLNEDNDYRIDSIS